MSKQKHIKYRDYLIESLKESEEAIGLLTTKLEMLDKEDAQSILMTLQDIAIARNGIPKEIIMRLGNEKP